MHPKRCNISLRRHSWILKRSWALSSQIEGQQLKTVCCPIWTCWSSKINITHTLSTAESYFPLFGLGLKTFGEELSELEGH